MILLKYIQIVQNGVLIDLELLVLPLLQGDLPHENRVLIYGQDQILPDLLVHPIYQDDKRLHGVAFLGALVVERSLLLRF